MSIGSLGMIGSVATTGQAQAKADVERVKESADAQARKIDSQTQAEDAAGIGTTDGENHETNERDADGRRLYEEVARAVAEEVPAESAPVEMPQAVDPNGVSGSRLDLTG